MKIAYFHGAAIPSRAASTIQVMKMCEAFAISGHEVLLLVPDKPDVERGVGDIHEHYGVAHSFRISLALWLRVPGRQYIAALHMVLKARLFGADLVYSRFAVAGLLATLIGLRVVHELHRPLSHSTPLEALAIRSLLLHPRMVRAVTISGALQRQYLADVPHIAGKVIVAHDASDVGDNFDAVKQSSRDFSVGYIGSLFPGRGMELIIALARECTFAQFHVVGGSAVEVEQYSADLYDLNNVHMYGYLPNPVAMRMLTEFDVVLAPYDSKVSVFGAPDADTSAFMSPLKLFEYMSAGKAIICSDHVVLQEVITQEETALICQRGNLMEWAKALRLLWQDPELRRTLGERAKILCRQNYSWGARAERVLNLNNKSLNKDAFKT
jgi:glycosyltransferase involved in cell wall biosynthesis